MAFYDEFGELVKEMGFTPSGSGGIIQTRTSSIRLPRRCTELIHTVEEEDIIVPTPSKDSGDSMLRSGAGETRTILDVCPHCRTRVQESLPNEDRPSAGTHVHQICINVQAKGQRVPFPVLRFRLVEVIQGIVSVFLVLLLGPSCSLEGHC